jgi:hypothetical protein
MWGELPPTSPGLRRFYTHFEHRQAILGGAFDVMDIQVGAVILHGFLV